MWKISIKKKAQKQLGKLSEDILSCYAPLFKEMELLEPYRKGWSHYGKLRGEQYHCHVKGGNPTYVMCWGITDKKSKQIEVYYVGTH